MDLCAIWRAAEIEAWLHAVRERGLLYKNLPDEMKQPVYDLICALNAAARPGSIIVVVE